MLELNKVSQYVAAIAVVAGAVAYRGAAQEQPAVTSNDIERRIKIENAGCISCHSVSDAPTMHATATVHLVCTDCHGGNPQVKAPAEARPGDREYRNAMAAAHPRPRLPQLWKSSSNPVRAAATWLQEDENYIRFVNPGDLRVAAQTCGRAGCHVQEVRAVRTSMMTHGGMLWGAALYNNGAFPLKDAHFGESYAADGQPQILHSWPLPSPDMTRGKGILPELDPLPRWEVSQPGNLLRVFERGGGSRVETGNPERDKDPGKPDDKLSNRGTGTLLRTDPVFLGLQKTRLMDPLLSMPGTNDHPGDYRASGCTACHVIYANDRDPSHSAGYARYGNRGTSAQADPTISKNEAGHPIKHQFTRSIPTSQCIVCHIHPGTNMVASYLGYTWWDNESDGDKMYPAKQHNPTDEERFKTWLANPEGAAARGLWKGAEFLAKTGTPEFNAQLKNMQFGDFHSHGWIFRAVYKRDRQGDLLDAEDRIVPPNDPGRFKKAVNLQDIHQEKGTQCSDCHFAQDSHGNGQLYGETRNAVEIDCIDCHGTISRKATLRTSAAAAPQGGHNMELLRTPWGQKRFFRDDGKLYQRSMVERTREPWEVVQVLDTVTRGNAHYNEKSAVAKTILRDGRTWGDTQSKESALAHANGSMTCYACHSSWTTSCFGCHLPMTSNGKSKMLHNEGQTTRNYTSYNFETLRDDIYMLGVDGTVTGHRIAPARSSCAVVVSSQNANRDWLYYQQPTVSSGGFSGFAFSTYYPHTVRARETKNCTDCHVSAAGDNNAWMAQLLMQGTHLMNSMGRYVYVAEGAKGFEAVPVAEHDDPPAVYGSDLHKIAYPDDYDKFVRHGMTLLGNIHHAGNVVDLQMRGEYLYAATGRGGFRIFDVANVDNKNFSQKITTAPASPLGQRLYVRGSNVTSVASPSTLVIDPLRNREPVNEERPVAMMYGFLYATDLVQGLLVIGNPEAGAKSPGVLTLLDGDPQNNFLKARFFNPGGRLDGAHRITIAGKYAYILCNRGLVVVDIENPAAPRITAEIGEASLVAPVAIAVQFRYAFVIDKGGLKVLDVTDPARPSLVPGASLALPDARNIYVARTYAYVAGGKQGLVIVNVRRPEHPALERIYSAEGRINDTRDVKLGITNASAFAYLADGVNGLRVVQIFAPGDNPNYLGFSPRPTPRLIATYRTLGPALAISAGIDRDRAVDESGNQLSVFNRRGSGPLSLEQMKRLYIHPETGERYVVSDAAPGPPAGLTTQSKRQP